MFSAPELDKLARFSRASNTKNSGTKEINLEQRRWSKVISLPEMKVMQRKDLQAEDQESKSPAEEGRSRKFKLKK